jgi:hypothetical protein
MVVPDSNGMPGQLAKTRQRAQRIKIIIQYRNLHGLL